MVDISKAGIYIIQNIVNGKIYVGSAKCLKRRWYQHQSDLRLKKHGNRYLQNAWNKYGECNVVFHPMINCAATKDELISMEQMYLDLFRPYDERIGYNLAKCAGSNQGVRFSDEARKRLSEAHKGQTAWNKGKTGYLSEQTRKALSDYANKQHQERGCGFMKGKHHTPETRAKMSVSASQKIVTENHRKNIGTGLANAYKTGKRKTTTYVVSTPTGLIEVVNHMSDYCAVHELGTSNMYAVASGRRKEHKGYKCVRVEVQ